MAACAENLTPMVAECGGKDAFIVDADADLKAAADACLWGALSNAGQTCVGVERVYVVDAVYAPFMRELSERAASIRAGEHYGPITMPGQLDIIRRHIDDATTSGKAIMGGTDSVRAPFVDPVIVEDVPEDSPRCARRRSGRRSPYAAPATPRRRWSWPTPRPTGWRARSSPATRGGRWSWPARCGPG